MCLFPPIVVGHLYLFFSLTNIFSLSKWCPFRVCMFSLPFRSSPRSGNAKLQIDEHTISGSKASEDGKKGAL